MKKIVLLMSVMLATVSAFSQYNIEIEIKGLKDTTLFLGYYFENSTFAIDSAYNNNGKFVFRGDKKLEAGIYFFAIRSGQYLELLIDNEKSVKMTTKNEDWLNELQIQKSDVNKIYYDYIKQTTEISKKLSMLNDEKNTLSKEEYAQRMFSINKEGDSVKDGFIKKHPKHLLSKILLATKNITVPDFSPVYDGQTDSVRWQKERYNYYIHHYFDNIDFQCDGLLRTPAGVFYKMYNEYWDEFMKYEPKDTIFALAVYWIEKARCTNTMFKFMVHNITERYLKSTYMGDDEIYIKMIDKYYATGDASWMPPSSIDKEVERANKWRNSMIGSIVPELICPDTNDDFHSLYAMKEKYKLLIFWSYSCSHCQTEIPKFYEAYTHLKDSISLCVMAVNSGEDLEQWKEKVRMLKLDWLNVNGLVANYDWHAYFDIETTPFVLLLDDKNRIIAKKLAAKNFEQYLKLYDSGKIKN